MTKKLTSEDKHAIDIILDRSAAAKAAGKTSYAPKDASSAPRVHRVRQFLQLLDLDSPAETPPDLVARTLAHISSKHLAKTWHDEGIANAQVG